MRTPTGPAHLYRERGKVIEAIKLTGVPPDGTNIDEVILWMIEGDPSLHPGSPVVKLTTGDDLLLRFHAPDKTWDARVGDWIIKHRNHVFSAVSDDEFDILYEVVE